MRNECRGEKTKGLLHPTPDPLPSTVDTRHSVPDFSLVTRYSTPDVSR